MSHYLPFEAAEQIKKKIGNFSPTLGIILGSGSGVIAEQVEPLYVINYADLPGFFECGVAGHQGQMILGYFSGHPVVCLKGRAHFYEGYDSETIQTMVRTLKLIGCERLVLTNAAASLKVDIKPGQIVLVSDHINFQFKNPLVGKNDERFGVRFPDMLNAYSPFLRQSALEAAKKLKIDLIEGVYLGVLGPCYETPAEIKAFQTLGATVVGMSTVPEVIVARHCGLEVIAFSIVTNLGTGLSSEDIILDHNDVLEVANKAAKNLALLLDDVICGQPSRS